MEEVKKDPVFLEEQEHLDETYAYISRREKALAREKSELFDKASAEKEEIAEDLRLGHADDTESFENSLEIENVNHVVDQYNIESAALDAQYKSVAKLMDEPYFARVRLQFPEDDDAEDYYIGNAALSDEDYQPVIIDWRSPIAETYYNQENGRTSYEVNGNRIDVDLLLRRQFDITRDRLNAYFDTQLAIEDPLLLKALSRRRSDKMSSITATIQKEQNAVIRYPDVPVLLVEGIAGSGKTSVLMQRIAFLMYRQRKTLNPRNVILMTLNPVFEEYISEVLPDMGEENPVTVTWADFTRSLGMNGREYQDQTAPGSLDTIDRKLASFPLTAADFRPVSQKGWKVLTRDEIFHLYLSLTKLGTTKRLTNVMVDQLTDLAKKKIRQKIRDKKAEDDEKKENGYLDEGGEDRENTGAARRLDNDFSRAFELINNFKWLDMNSVGTRLLSKPYLTEAELLYLNLVLTGRQNIHAQYVMIDEVQDYTEVQLRILRLYYNRAHFLFLGDENQAIRPGTVSFDRIRELFAGTGRREVRTLSLMTSYRSSPEITALFTTLLPEKDRLKAASVQRPGLDPVIKNFETKDEYMDALKKAVREAKNEEGLTAVIANSHGTLDSLHSRLGTDCPTVIRADSVLPSHGVIMMTLALAKGLEFDSVIIPDGDSRAYPDTPVKRHQLYTAVSRATKRLTIVAQGTLSPLLN